MTLPERPHGPSEKSRTVALALAFVLGVFGAHRFYTGRTGSGIVMLLTLGGLGLWWLFDLIVVAAGGFRDADGRLVSDWDPGSGDPRDRRDLEAALDELDRLRDDVTELAERLEFAERLLARPRDPGGAR
ncbi:MAG TPA: TM2 domain-containing protein [Gemmatimonadales bacterium]|jgi:hypothetical protein|nr:TM2 domain-containing protein [Gemmatimonadales bacterium]HSE53763.1 TM2 domain-containing protein [Gemmatimonadales bacterium]